MTEDNGVENLSSVIYHVELPVMGTGWSIWVMSVEYMINVPVPEWGEGKHLYLPFHDPGVVTERGVELPYPPVPGIVEVH